MSFIILHKKKLFYKQGNKCSLKPLILTIGGVLLFTNSAMAQTDNNEEKNSFIEEVVVTSQKREENLQEVPIHIQAFQSDRFDNAHISRVEEIVNISPTVSFSARRGFDQTSVRIRGVGTQELGSGVEPSVATVVDGVVMARGGSTFNELPDIERVEVLNGPQGTLFGKNASVGLINIVTKKPNREEVEANFSVKATSDEDYGGTFGYSAPINDKLAFRMSSFWRYFDGNVDNIVTGNEVNGVDAFGIRGKMSWDLSDSLDVLFSLDFSRQVTECCARIHREERVSPAIAGGRPGTPDIDSSFVNFRGENLSGGALAGSAAEVLGPQITIGPENDKIAQNFDPFQESINRGFSVELNKTLAGDLTLTSLTAYREWEAISGWDNDFTAFPFQERQRSDRDVNWFSQEIRLTSPADETFDYILGLYYYTATTDAMELSDRVTIDTGQDQLFRIRAESGYDNIAIFGHFNYHVLDKLLLFSGFRLLNDQAHATAQWEACQGRDAKTQAPDFDCASPQVSGKKDDTKFIYKAGLQYYLSDDINTYASYSTGYKGRGYSLEFGLSTDRILNGEEPIKGEESTSFEVGIRGTLYDKLRFNIVYYNTIIEGLQQSLRDLTTIANVLGSVDETTTRGVEVNIDTYLTDSLSLSASYGYNEAFYSDFVNANCYLAQTAAQGCINNIQDRTGDSLEAAAKNRVILSSRYESQGNSLRHFVQLNYRWQSDANVSSNGDPTGVQESFGIVDLSLGLISADEKYTISLFAKNLLDEHYIQGADVNGADMGGVVLHYLPRDFKRFMGISLNYQL